MFVGTSHQPQLLHATAYSSPAQWQTERQSLFEPTWHFVGSMPDLPREGSFFTTELLDRPLIVWRSAGEVHCFLNICSHRFARLTGHTQGCSARLKCQYHGWEYDHTGLTRKIPDAGSFRPMEAGAMGLTRFTTAVCGPLIFVALTPNPIPFAEAYPAAAALIAQQFHETDHRIMAYSRDVEINWKVKIENTVESYHVDCVHPRSFQASPPASSCQHRIHPWGTVFTTSERRPSAYARWQDDWIHWWMGRKQDYEYQHVLCYPSLMFGKAGIFRWIETVTPIAPTACRIRLHNFCQPSLRSNPASALVEAVVRREGARVAQVAMDEDLAVLHEVQRGLMAPELPAGGLISVREERIHHFQNYINDTCGRSKP